jgi:hypothetical protein
MWEIHIRETHLELHVIKWFIILLIHLWVCQVILMTNSQILITLLEIKNLRACSLTFHDGDWGASDLR